MTIDRSPQPGACVWVTKYVASKGIIEAIFVTLNEASRTWIVNLDPTCPYLGETKYLAPNVDVFVSYEEALQDSIKRLETKIAYSERTAQEMRVQQARFVDELNRLRH